mmetsp:Transcript_61095/g.197531  ORF Transcript_61095/g.197531 Transcript_61095/m.197531 type:complete len:206 (-) Transcript_61095:870-1487(-)
MHEVWQGCITCLRGTQYRGGDPQEHEGLHGEAGDEPRCLLAQLQPPKVCWRTSLCVLHHEAKGVVTGDFHKALGQRQVGYAAIRRGGTRNLDAFRQRREHSLISRCRTEGGRDIDGGHSQAKVRGEAIIAVLPHDAEALGHVHSERLTCRRRNGLLERHDHLVLCAASLREPSGGDVQDLHVDECIAHGFQHGERCKAYTMVCVR